MAATYRFAAGEPRRPAFARGRAADRAGRVGPSAIFALPASSQDVWLCSGAGASRDVDPRPDGDARRLGLPVGELEVAGGGLLAAGDPRLDGAGWHASEGDRRWTSGRAWVPAGL